MTWKHGSRVAHVWAKERSISAPPAYAGASGMFTAMGIATEDSSTRCDAVPQLTWRPRGVAHLPHSAGHQNSALIQMPPWTRGAEAAERAKAPVSRSGALNSMKEVQSSSQHSQPWLEWLGHCWSAGKCNSPPPPPLHTLGDQACTSKRPEVSLEGEHLAWDPSLANSLVPPLVKGHPGLYITFPFSSLIRTQKSVQGPVSFGLNLLQFWSCLVPRPIKHSHKSKRRE